MTVKFQLRLTTYLHAHSAAVQYSNHVMKVIVGKERKVEGNRGQIEMDSRWNVCTVIETPSLSVASSLFVGCLALIFYGRIVRNE